MRKKMALIIFFALIAYSIAYADRGLIPFMSNIQIFEPNQRAMIVWNGKEEILLLSTDLKASGATEVLEVLPLPSEPVVKKGDVEIFKKAVQLINIKLRNKLNAQNARGMGYAGKGMGLSTREQPAGEVTFHEKIGSHHIAVAHVLDTNGFIEWAEKYIGSSGAKNPTIPEAMKTVVGEYIKEGYSVFK